MMKILRCAVAAGLAALALAGCGSAPPPHLPAASCRVLQHAAQRWNAAEDNYVVMVVNGGAASFSQVTDAITQARDTLGALRRDWERLAGKFGNWQAVMQACRAQAVTLPRLDKAQFAGGG